MSKEEREQEKKYKNKIRMRKIRAEKKALKNTSGISNKDISVKSGENCAKKWGLTENLLNEKNRLKSYKIPKLKHPKTEIQKRLNKEFAQKGLSPPIAKKKISPSLYYYSSRPFGLSLIHI